MLIDFESHRREQLMLFFVRRLTDIRHDVILERIKLTARRDLRVKLANRTGSYIPRIRIDLCAFLSEFTVDPREIFSSSASSRTSDH